VARAAALEALRADVALAAAEASALRVGGGHVELGAEVTTKHAAAFAELALRPLDALVLGGRGELFMPWERMTPEARAMFFLRGEW
jgi:hypothetical protein